MESELWDALEVGGGRGDRATPCDSTVWSDAAEGAPRSLPGVAGLDEVYVPSVGESGRAGPLPQNAGTFLPVALHHGPRYRPCLNAI
jgi:hypothetical protein